MYTLFFFFNTQLSYTAVATTSLESVADLPKKHIAEAKTSAKHKAKKLAKKGLKHAKEGLMSWWHSTTGLEDVTELPAETTELVEVPDMPSKAEAKQKVDEVKAKAKKHLAKAKAKAKEAAAGFMTWWHDTTGLDEEPKGEAKELAKVKRQDC